MCANDDKKTESPPASTGVVDCYADQPCKYPELVDFRVIVITYNRAVSMMKLLVSLNAVELDGASARLEIWIDVNAKGEVDNATLQAAKSFTWAKGPTRVHIQKKHVGIYGQWIDTWAPQPNSAGNFTEIGIIFEDDISASPQIYRWLKAVHRHYGHRNDFFSATLTSQTQSSHDGSGRGLSAPKNHTAFMYKCVGTWGHSPNPRQWLNFQNWFHKEARPDPKFHPYVPGIAPTEWYKGYESSGTADSMWEQWAIYFSYKEKLYTVYSNLNGFVGDGKCCLCINRAEVGLHNSHKGSEDLSRMLSTWKDEFVAFPKTTVTLDWSGLPKIGY